MSQPLRIRALQIYRLRIPMRMRFEHAAAARATADPLVVRFTAAAPYAHLTGHGETLARAYVTGETADSVVDDVTKLFAPRISAFAPASFVEALEFIDALPTQLGGRIVTAARAAVELGLLDLACRAFQRRPADVAGWMGLAGFGPPGCLATARYSGEVIGRTRAKLRWLLRLQRLYGLTDFKLKVAVAGWEERLAWAWGVLRHGLAAKRVTLRVDANAGWELAEANEAVPTLEHYGVSALEQPFAESQDADLPWLAEQTRCELIADESVLTIADAQRLAHGGGVRVFNIRLAKQGGLMPSLRIARLALTAGLDVQLGCLVGETSLLSAAGVAFLEACPRVRFVEGAFGGLLLRDDICRRVVRFGFGGRMRSLPGPGFGVEVELDAVERLSEDKPSAVQF